MKLWSSILRSVYANRLYILDQVLDGDSIPIASATVVLYKNNKIVDQCATDAQGIYKFEDLQPGDYFVEIYTESTTSKLVVDFGTVTQPVLGRVVYSNIVPPTVAPVQTNGETTSVSITDPGEKYSSYLPPVITTPDGFVAKATVDPVTGTITGTTTLKNGTGSAQTATTYPTYDANLSYPIQNKTVGTLPVNQITNDDINDFYLSFIDAYATDTSSLTSLHYGSLYNWYQPPPYLMTSKLVQKIHEVYASPILNGVAISRHIKDIGYYPSGTATVYVGGSWAWLQGSCDCWSLTHHASIAEPWISVLMYQAQVITVSCEQNEYGAYYPVGENWLQGAGTHASYDAFMQSRQTYPPQYPVISKTSEPTLLEAIVDVLDRAVGILLFRDFREALLQAGADYVGALALNYVGGPAKDDLIPIQVATPVGGPSLDQSNPYNAFVYGLGLSSGENNLSLGSLYYPYLNGSGNPTSTNTGIPNPNYDPNCTTADFQQIKGYLGTKYLPEAVIAGSPMEPVFNAIQSFDAKYGTAFGTVFATTASIAVSGLHEIGQLIGSNAGGSSWAKEWSDFKEQSAGAITLTAPEYLHGKSFTVNATDNPAYAFVHSWDSVGAYTITKVAK